MPDIKLGDIVCLAGFFHPEFEVVGIRKGRGLVDLLELEECCIEVDGSKWVAKRLVEDVSTEGLKVVKQEKEKEKVK